MPVIAIDHLILPVADVAAAAAPFERLGLTLTPLAQHSTGHENRAFFAGNGDTEFYVEILGVHDRARAELSPSWTVQQRAREGGTGATGIVLRCDDLEVLQASLSRAGTPGEIAEAFREDGSKLCDILRPDVSARAGCEVSFIRYPESASSRAARHSAAGLFRHALPLLRVDHLAIIAPALDEMTAFWADVLNVPVYGEVRGRGMVIRQMKIGDAVVELLGPDSPESPLASRPAGLISMAAFEVTSLDGAVEFARGRGFTAPDGAAGVLPRSRTSTISPNQLSGLALQLIEFV